MLSHETTYLCICSTLNTVALATYFRVVVTASGVRDTVVGYWTLDFRFWPVLNRHDVTHNIISEFPLICNQFSRDLTLMWYTRHSSLFTWVSQRYIGMTAYARVYTYDDTNWVYLYLARVRSDVILNQLYSNLILPHPPFRRLSQSISFTNIIQLPFRPYFTTTMTWPSLQVLHIWNSWIIYLLLLYCLHLRRHMMSIHNTISDFLLND